MKAEAELLRNRLLAWRFGTRHFVGVKPGRAIPNLSARGNQAALALLSLIDDAAVRRSIGDELLAREASQAVRRAASPDRELVSILYSLFRQTSRPHVAVAEVTAAYNLRLSERGERTLTAKAVGWLIRSRLRIVTMKSRGIYVVPQSEWPEIERRAKRRGLADTGAVSTEDAP